MSRSRRSCERFLKILDEPAAAGRTAAAAARNGRAGKDHSGVCARAELAAVQSVSQVHGRRALHSGGGGSDAVSPSATTRVGEVYRSLQDKTMLHLALLLHDLGKGFEEDHSEVGRRIARDDGRAIAACRRSRPRRWSFWCTSICGCRTWRSSTIRRSRNWWRGLSRRSARESQLDLLFLVTCADLAAVGPDVLNSWKVEVLSELYFRAAQKFAAEGDTGSRRDRQRRAQRGVAVADAGRAERSVVRAATGRAAGSVREQAPAGGSRRYAAAAATRSRRAPAWRGRTI